MTACCLQCRALIPSYVTHALGCSVRPSFTDETGVDLRDMPAASALIRLRQPASIFTGGEALLGGYRGTSISHVDSNLGGYSGRYFEPIR